MKGTRDWYADEGVGSVECERSGVEREIKKEREKKEKGGGVVCRKERKKKGKKRETCPIYVLKENFCNLLLLFCIFGRVQFVIVICCLRHDVDRVKSLPSIASPFYSSGSSSTSMCLVTQGVCNCISVIDDHQENK